MIARCWPGSRPSAWSRSSGDSFPGTAWSGGAWVKDPKFTGGLGAGHVAIADFGAYGTGVPSKNPEIVVVANNKVAIYAVTGEMVMPPTAVPGAGAWASA